MTVNLNLSKSVLAGSMSWSLLLFSLIQSHWLHLYAWLVGDLICSTWRHFNEVV